MNTIDTRISIIKVNHSKEKTESLDKIKKNITFAQGLFTRFENRLLIKPYQKYHQFKRQ